MQRPAGTSLGTGLCKQRPEREPIPLSSSSLAERLGGAEPGAVCAAMDLRRLTRRVSRIWVALALALPAWVSSCSTSPKIRDHTSENIAVQAISLLGVPLVPPPLPPETEVEYRKNLLVAELRYRRAPHQIETITWLGRRSAYLGYYREAIEVFTRGLGDHDENPRLLRHRGHRFITTRQFDLAIADLTTAREKVRGTPDVVEPDGIPNATLRPLSTLHFNIAYHLGLALYLAGDFEGSVAAYRECLANCQNPDTQCAAAYWLVLGLLRTGDEASAKEVLASIGDDLQLIENEPYYRLLEVLGGSAEAEPLLERAREVSGQFATIAYGIAMHWTFTGEETRAEALLNEVARQPNWAAFGVIAAEAEIAARSRREAPRRPTS